MCIALLLIYNIEKNGLFTSAHYFCEHLGASNDGYDTFF